MTEDARLVTLDGAAQMLDVSRRTVDRLVAAGDLQAIRIGPRTVRVERAEVERLLRERRKGKA